ncbi:MAG TPA: hypothetical protein VH208_02805 [Myxococcaceae bacterium]|nr:hypothetical protein [Myxococcaceae bacterium]
MNPLIDSNREIANRAFAQWVPRSCDEKWLETVSGAARYRWDVQALQEGFIEPLYRVFAARPERWRPALASALMRVSGLDPMRHSSLLAALELCYLAGAMLTHVENGKTLGESTPADMDLPLSVLTTVAFTVSTYGMSLITSHAPELGAHDRVRLMHALMQSQVRAGIATALDNHQVAHTDTRPPGAEAFLAHVGLCAGDLVFGLPLECALAATRSAEAAFIGPLREGAHLIGRAYYLSTELLMSLRPQPPGGLELPLESPLRWRFADALGGEALSCVERALDAACHTLQRVSHPLADTLLAFTGALCERRVADIRREIHA